MTIRHFPALGALLAFLALGATPAHAKVRVIAATDTLAWVTQHIGGNPHYEFSPEVIRTIVAPNILAGFRRVDPAHASTYQANYNTLSSQLQAAERRWRAKLAPYRGKEVVTYHKTFPYLLDFFG